MFTNLSYMSFLEEDSLVSCTRRQAFDISYRHLKVVNILLYLCTSLRSQNRRSLKVVLVHCYYDRVER